MNFVNVYVLKSLALDVEDNVVSENVGVTFSIHEAEAHKTKDIANEYETFEVGIDWREASATTELVLLMRDYIAEVKEAHAAALR